MARGFSDSLVTEDFWNTAKEGAQGTLMTFTYDPQKFEAARPLLQRFKAADYSPEAIARGVELANAFGGLQALAGLGHDLRKAGDLLADLDAADAHGQ